MDKKIKLMIGIPTASALLHRKFVQSLMSLKYPPNVEVDINICEGFQLPFARNRIVQNALEKNCDYMFWLDADMVFAPDTLVRLFNRHVDICHALSFRRIKPHYPCVFTFDSEKKSYITVDYSTKEDLFEVDAAGSACTLVKTDVYRKLTLPYYYYRDHFFSSDLTVSENMRKAGYKIYVDKTVKTGHIGEEIVVDESFYLAHLLPDEKEKWNKQIQQQIEQHYVTEKELYKKK